MSKNVKKYVLIIFDENIKFYQYYREFIVINLLYENI